MLEDRSCNLLGHICCKQLRQISSSSCFFLLSSYFLFRFSQLSSPSRSLSKEHCWGCKTFFNKAELAWGFWGSYLLSNLLKASNPKWVPLEVFLTISNASPSVREIKAWRAWAETSSAPIREIIFKWPFCDSHIHCRFQLLDDLNCILVTWLNPCLELVVPRVPGTRQSWELFRLGNAFQLAPISDIDALLHNLELLIHIRLKCLWHSGCGLWLLTHWLLQCLLKLLLPLGQLLNHLHQNLLIALLWTSLWLMLHLASATTNPARTEAVRQLVFPLLLLDLRTPAPLPCKDILGSYTYVRVVSAQAHSFTRPHESEVNT